jgi:hypothetical protein
MMIEGSSVEDWGGYMLDTTVFNAVVKARLPLSALAGRRLFATHVQLDELENTSCEQLRARLRAAFEEIAAERLPTESAVWDVSKWDQAKWPAEDGNFEKMLARLEELDGKKRHPNQLRDILIAETAIKNSLTLVSGDPNLRTVTTEFGGRVIEMGSLKRE